MNSECIICHKKNLSFLDKMGKWQIVKCQNDGLIFIDPPPSYSEFSDFYNSGRYFHSTQNRFGYKNYLQEKKFLDLNFTHILDKIEKVLSGLTSLPHIKKGDQRKLLDIGSAHGFFVSQASSRGFDARGVDLSQEAVRYAQERGLNVALGTTKMQKYPSGSFDVITLLGVVEHFLDPRQETEEISRILKDGGLLVILTLDTSNFVGRGAIKPPEHLFYFSKDNLIKFLAEFEFRPIRTFTNLTFFSFEEFIFHLLGRLFKFNKPTKLENLITQITSRLFLNRVPIPVPDGQILLILQKRALPINPYSPTQLLENDAVGKMGNGIDSSNF
jgi:2-polyprenyl-3-methyl-5-hydroxy-6-metoxy-1,4-benzoquinol methylase